MADIIRRNTELEQGKAELLILQDRQKNIKDLEEQLAEQNRVAVLEKSAVEEQWCRKVLEEREAA